MRGTSVAVILIVSVLITGLAFAGPYEDATKAYKQGDYDTAFRLIEPLGKQGIPEAQYNLGVMYAVGNGVRQDYAEAMKWFRKAADQGDAASQFSIGEIYVSGYGVPQDYAEAAKWYRKAADQGYADAQRSLGEMYESGQGVKKDYVLAHMWYDLASSRYPASEREWGEMARGKRDMIASRMTPAQVADAKRLAGAWKPKKER